MEKEEIISSRIGGLGSSDAKLVAQAGRSGVISDTLRFRIAQMLGLEERKQFSTSGTRKGDRIEAEVYQILKLKNGNVVSNPPYKHENLSLFYGFDIINHIDYEFETDDYLYWVENKATKKDAVSTRYEYSEQLDWHYLLLRDKATKLGKKPVLLFSHYQTNEDEDEIFDPEKFQSFQVAASKQGERDIIEGLNLIQEELKNFVYEKKETLTGDMLPEKLQDEAKQVYALLLEIKERENTIEAFKEKLCVMMEAAGCKSIKNELFNITFVAKTQQVKFDSKKYKADNPTLDLSAYNKISPKKAYVKLELK